MSPRLFLLIIDRTFAKQKHAKTMVGFLSSMVSLLDTMPRKRR